MSYEHANTLLYRCPRTGLQLQGFATDQAADERVATVQVDCHACGSVHFINPKTEAMKGEHRPQAASVGGLVFEKIHLFGNVRGKESFMSREDPAGA